MQKKSGRGVGYLRISPSLAALLERPKRNVLMPVNTVLGEGNIVSNEYVPGMNAFLKKPFNVAQLRDTLRSLNLQQN